MQEIDVIASKDIIEGMTSAFRLCGFRYAAEMQRYVCLELGGVPAEQQRETVIVVNKLNENFSEQDLRQSIVAFLYLSGKPLGRDQLKAMYFFIGAYVLRTPEESRFEPQWIDTVAIAIQESESRLLTA